MRTSSKRWLPGALALRAAVDLVLALTRSPVVAGTALAVYGVGTSTGSVAYQSTLQAQVPAALRGRAFTTYDVLWNFARLVSLGLGGLLTDARGVQAVYVLGAALLAVAVIVGASGEVQQPPAHGY